MSCISSHGRPSPHRLHDKATQFLATEDSFVFSMVKKDGPLASWTAVRKGAARRRASAGAEGRRTLLSKYGWYVFFAILYVGYKAVMSKVAQGVGIGKDMATKKKSK